MAKKGGSKVATALISFLIGFLFAFIVEVGALFGVGLVVYNTDVDKLLSFVGIDNSAEEYVANPNHDKSLKDVVTDVNDKLFDGSWDFSAITSKSFDDINAVLPFVKGKVLSTVYDMLDPYVQLNKARLESAKFAGGDIDGDGIDDPGLLDVLRDEVMSIKTASLVDKLMGGTDLGQNQIVRAILMGAEAESATVNYGVSSMSAGRSSVATGIPVLYDMYERQTDGYYRILNHFSRGDETAGYDVDNAFPGNIDTRLLYSDDSDENKFRLYYAACRVTEEGIFEPEYTINTIVKKFKVSQSGQEVERDFSFDVVEFAEGTDFIAVKPDSEGNYVLNHTAILQSLNADRRYPDTSDKFVGYSYYEPYARDYYYFENIYEDPDASVKKTTDWKLRTYCGINYYRTAEEEMVEFSPRTVFDLSYDIYGPLDNVPISAVFGDDDFTGKVFGKTSLGALFKPADKGGIDLKKKIDKLELSTFINNVEPDNKLMAYIVYKLSDMAPVDGEEYWTGTYDKDGSNPEYNVRIYLNGNHIDRVVGEDGEKEGATVESISSLTDQVTVAVILDIKANDQIMMYLGYGISGVHAEAGEIEYTRTTDTGTYPNQRFAYDHVGTFNVGNSHMQPRDELSEKKCYIATDASGVVKAVALWEGGQELEMLSATRVNEMLPRIESMMDYITLPGFIDVNPDEVLSTFIGYSISKIEKIEESPLPTDEMGNTYMYRGEYKADGQVYTCYVNAAPNGEKNKITEAWYITGTAGDYTRRFIWGNSVNDLGNKMDDLTVDDMFSPADIGSSPILSQLRGVKLTELADAINDVLIQRIYSREIYGFPEDCEPLEMVEFVDGDNDGYGDGEYYYVKKGVDGEGHKTFTFTIVNDENPDASTHGRVSVAEFTGRDKKEYYVRELSGYDEENNPVYTYKIVGYRLVAGHVTDFRIGWLYYEENEGTGAYDLCSKHVTPSMTENEKYDVLGNLTPDDLELAIAEGKTHYTYGEAFGMWRLVLYKKVDFNGDGVLTLVEKAYTINNFNNMVSVCAENVYTATLEELVEANVITDMTESDLNKSLTWLDHGTPRTMYLREMTFQQLVSAVTSMAT